MATFARLLFLSSLLSLVQRGASTQMCAAEAEQSISGMMLQRHVYKTTVAKLGYECLFVCRQEDICQSFNFVVSKGMCEFNNRTKEARPEDYIPNWDRYYFRRDRHRVPLGSIPELPAASCSEIKASEGGHAVSGQHWIDSVIPGRAILLHCDMVTEDMDECNASSLVCDVNAICQNTRGSYLCSCKTGFTGDGKTCSDVDECANSSNGCHVNAICTNTYGSYRCACKPTYSGDGKTCFKFSHRGFSESNILDGLNSTYLVQLVAYLDPVLQSSNNSRFVRCWRAKTDGWAASTFHSNCDGKGPTVSIIKVGSYIFGGYTDQSWYSSSCQYFPSSKSFIYSLYNINGYAPVKLQIKSGRHSYAICRCSSYGPTFGGGHDIRISNNAASNQVSYTYCGHTYPLPPGYSSSGSSCAFYAGSYKFTPSDIEVFYEITT